MKQSRTKNQERACEKPFHFDPYQSSESIKSKGVPTKMLVDDIAIRQLAYEIFKEKGGSDLDNWFEAERTLNDNY